MSEHAIQTLLIAFYIKYITYNVCDIFDIECDKQCHDTSNVERLTFYSSDSSLV